MDQIAHPFFDRADAGRQLAKALAALGLDRPVIFALPQGGVPVGVEVAKALNAPLDLLLLRKIGAPQTPEVALGAIVEGANREVVINENVKRLSGADEAYIAAAVAEQRDELERRKKVFLGSRTRLDPRGRTVVIVDDGPATGATMKAALIGFGTGSGTVAAASESDAPMETKAIRPPRPDSYEALCRAVNLDRFLWDFKKDQSPEFLRLLNQQRLQRYIGVMYRPETERTSHYSYANLPEQYDAFVWFDKTLAVTALPTPTTTTEDETYPFGL